jgi:hypothetical protein
VHCIHLLLCCGSRKEVSNLKNLFKNVEGFHVIQHQLLRAVIQHMARVAEQQAGVKYVELISCDSNSTRR